MPLDDVVIPEVQAVLVNSLETVSSPLFGLLGAIRYGEQFQVAQPPELWILNKGGSFPEKQGSELEQSDWTVTLKALFPWANDQKQAEDVLGALIEPIRETFRLHLHLFTPTKVARARILNADWSWTVVNGAIYRVVELKLAVREKVPVQFNP
jgi:hypothetical protein